MHVTIRMAWHDNAWDGSICQNPEANSYCVGTHSLLSGRIEKNRNIEFEKDKHGAPLPTLSVEKIPPCYWSVNAFGNNAASIQHTHVFSWLNIPAISDTLEPHTVFTWPFKLSFVHDEKNKKKHGNYPPDLEKRIQDFIAKFTPCESIIFFYANYDNPVSADDMKYLLLGCSVLASKPETTEFKIETDKLKRIRSKPKTRNFPTMNWALKFKHDPSTAVLLPYREYVRYAEENPDDAEKLEDMRVLVDESSLVSGFKYVCMDIDDDKCLYLLYKVRKSIKKIQEHNQVVVKSDLLAEEARIENLIRAVWEKRGLYPTLEKILNRFVDDLESSRDLARALTQYATSKKDVLQILTSIKDGDEIPDELTEYEDLILDLLETRRFSRQLEPLIKLSLFQLTDHQINKIIEDPNLLPALKENPYALYEDYRADQSDLDEPNLIDEPIDLYKVDIGMIPDRRFVNRHRSLQNLGEDSPQRLRAVIVDYLKGIGEVQGHCYDDGNSIMQALIEQPLIYKTNVQIDQSALDGKDADYNSHFIEKLHLSPQEGKIFFYLKQIWEAEDRLRTVVDSLTKRKDHPAIRKFTSKKYVDSSLKALAKLPGFEEAQFRAERQLLFQNVFRKSLFLLTGRPGSGKTYEVSKIIEVLRGNGEEVIVLAPTGKAALRLTQNIAQNTTLDLKAETIDRFIFSRKFGWANEDPERLSQLREKDKLSVENLIIDESSMIDLKKLNVLLSIIRMDDKSFKRLIMVGDENQLPPIGYGKPFHDTIIRVLSDDHLRDKHYVNLLSNCRQENDPKILELAEAFTDKTRYYEEALELIEHTGKISKGLEILRWNNKDDLKEQLLSSLDKLIPRGTTDDGEPLTPTQRLNRFFGLYDNGHVNNKDFRFRETLKLDVFQLLAPYRAGHSGTLGLNKSIQQTYRKTDEKDLTNPFYHSDKLIRVSNWYWGYGADRTLKLSNGSMGIAKGEKPNRQYYFPDLDKPVWSIDSEDNFELAYAITVHKAQGSDFETVFLIIPNKLPLLCKELVYTALTRSRHRLVILLQNSKENLLATARSRSHLLRRNTSVFTPPSNNKREFEPAKGVFVKSKAEFIIYKALEKSGLKFKYEEELALSNRSYVIHPDFTIFLNDKNKIFWEHLGMLDVRKYYRDWQRRKIDYEDHKFFDMVVTTDDLEGLKDEHLERVIQDIKSLKLKKSKGNRFSNQHYTLY
jgi:exodeoxyribonuclease V alpha subunit